MGCEELPIYLCFVTSTYLVRTQMLHGIDVLDRQVEACEHWRDT